jgi:nucleoside-diphosphate-sugar epimerase
LPSRAYSSEMRIVVTGASGFIGRALMTSLRAAGHEAVTDLRGAHALVHLAAIAHRRGVAESELRRVNFGMAVDTGRSAAVAGVPMIFMSSVKVHGEESDAAFREDSPIVPRDAYARSKAEAEDGLRAIAGLKLTVLRPPLVYGPSVKANFLSLMRAIARGMPLPLAGIENRRSLIYVGNLCDAVLACLGTSGKSFLVSDGAPVSTPQLCRAIGAALGRPARLFRVPPGLIPGTALKSSLEMDDSAIRTQLGWKPPFSFEQGLSATAAWYRNR